MNKERNVTADEVLDMHLPVGFSKASPDIYNAAIAAMKQFASREIIDYLQSDESTIQDEQDEKIDRKLRSAMIWKATIGRRLKKCFWA